MVTRMPPKPKKRGIKSIVDGFGSLFSSRGRRDEQLIAHDQPTVEGSPGNFHASSSLEEREGSTAGAVTLVSAPEHPLSSHSSGDPSMAGARDHRRPPLTEHNPPMSMFSNAQNFKIDNVNVHPFQDSQKGGM